MTPEQILERNIAIAKFLQLKDVGTQKIIYAVFLDGKAINYYSPENLKFHKSWDWLMPVIQQLYRHDVHYTVDEEMVKASIPYEPIEFIFAKVYNWIQKINNNEGLR